MTSKEVLGSCLRHPRCKARGTRAEAKNVELEGPKGDNPGPRPRRERDVDLEPTYVWWWRCSMETAS